MVVFALLSAPIALGLAYVPVFVRAAILTKHKKFDNTKPRTEVKINAKVDELVKRCNGAHNNQLETLGPYTAGIAAAVAVGVPGGKLASIAKTYVGSRIVYNAAYIAPQILEGAPRSLAFFGAIGSVIALWVAAAVKAGETENVE